MVIQARQPTLGIREKTILQAVGHEFATALERIDSELHELRDARQQRLLVAAV